MSDENGGAGTPGEANLAGKFPVSPNYLLPRRAKMWEKRTLSCMTLFLFLVLNNALPLKCLAFA